MFVTANQFYVFISCVFLGVFLGLPLSFVKFVNFLVKNKILTNVLYVIYFINLSLAYVYFAHALYFPSFRIYMIIGVLLGLFAYMKSLHFILAKLVEKLYNRISKKHKEKLKNDRIKI